VFSVSTTTWNSIDLIGIFLAHYRKLGFERLLVMDFDSTDGTRDILNSQEWRGLVELVPFPGIALLDSSNIMLSILRSTCESFDWCLFCDPDELLVTPTMSIQDPALREQCADAESASIPRFNVTAPLSVARCDEQRLTAVDAITLRIDRRHSRSRKEREKWKEALHPPWIFTAIPGKVLVQPRTAIAVGEGDHSVRTLHAKSVAAPDGVYLLHYPFRRYSAFRDKIELARIGFDLNPHLSQDHGWQVRRWVKLANSDRLYEEYLQQFVADEDVPQFVSHGSLFRDGIVRRFHR